MLKRYAKILHRELEVEEAKWWENFLSQFTVAQAEWAFEGWLRNRGAGEWWPTGQKIAELCAAYGRVERQKELPIGCERCDWTGFYMTVASRTIKGNENREDRKLAAECPCRQDASLRTPCTKRRATEPEMRDMWTKVKALAEEKSMETVIAPRRAQSAVALTREQIEARKSVERAESARVRRAMEEGA